MRRRNGGHEYIHIRSSNEDEVLVLVCTPILFEQSPPNQHDRLTAPGLANLSDGTSLAQGGLTKQAA